MLLGGENSGVDLHQGIVMDALLEDALADVNPVPEVQPEAGDAGETEAEPHARTVETGTRLRAGRVTPTQTPRDWRNSTPIGFKLKLDWLLNGNPWKPPPPILSVSQSK